MGDTAVFRTSCGNFKNVLRCVMMDHADPEVSAELGPFATFTVGVEVDCHVAVMVGVNSVLHAFTVRIPSGNHTVLNVYDLDLLTHGQAGVQHHLIAVVGVRPEDVPGVDAVHVPIGIGGEQVVAVVKRPDMFPAQFLVACVTVGNKIVSAFYAELRINNLLRDRIIWGVSRHRYGFFFHRAAY